MGRAPGGRIRHWRYTCLEKRKFVSAVGMEKGKGVSERKACKLVGISRTSYYDWKQAEKKLAVVKNPLAKVISYCPTLSSTMGRIET